MIKPLKESKAKTPISGYSLERLGWSKCGFVWRKHKQSVTYDGCNWLLNGFKVQYIEELP